MSKIAKSAQGEQCSLRLECCNFNSETTIWAHISLGFNSGMGMKPLDLHGCYACSSCHDALDGRMSYQVDYRDVLRAMIESQQKLMKKGLIANA
ncbi:MAG: nuclease domain-containing protein [Pseudomonadota bacterium]|nr:nuclease domain-containing protein [Pseudomonadota bacterium]